MANLPYKTRPLIWIGDSKAKLAAFPKGVRVTFGTAITLVQNGETPPIAKALAGFGSGVFELKENTGGEAYRVIYVVKLKRGVYILDAIHKKSKSGKGFPKEIKKRIAARLVCAKQQD